MKHASSAAGGAECGVLYRQHFPGGGPCGWQVLAARAGGCGTLSSGSGIGKAKRASQRRWLTAPLTHALLPYQWLVVCSPPFRAVSRPQSDFQKARFIKDQDSLRICQGFAYIGAEFITHGIFIPLGSI